MTPSARVQAAIELLDQIVEAAARGGAAADTLIARYFKDRRYAGSKDRRAVRDLVYRAIRRAGERPETGRAAMIGLTLEDEALAALFDGSPHGPVEIRPGEKAAEAGAVPQWLHARLDPLVEAGEWPSLLERAPLDVRVNILKGRRAEAMERLPGAVPTPHSPLGLRLEEGFQVENTDAWASGLVEVQDEGSQLLALACEAAPGMTVIDLCAGAGGKTLALAAGMKGEGRVVASDVDRARLSRLAPRLGRSGASNVETRLLNPGRELEALHDLRDKADLVLIDAPCSGTGTWRRNPETRWRLTEKRLRQLAEVQSHLLGIGAALVRPGGRLVYAVCSLLAEEGRDQAAAFTVRSSFAVDRIAMNAGRQAGDGVLLTPARDGTDGFFVARWRRP
ncbi:MAG TPA: RsmB/NOP family class I SAM-dependent RNA methyltransferase, partial [Allosphingosinicella sp.]